ALPACRIHWDGGVIEPRDPDRKATEWVLSVGGTVDFAGASRVAAVKDLPAGPFQLHRVTLQSVKPLADQDLARPDGPQRLIALDLQYTTVGDAGLDRLQRLPNLKSLYLTQTNVTDQGLGRLRRFPALATVTAGGPAISNAGLAALCDLPELGYLGLSGPKI